MHTLTVDAESRISIPDVKPGQVFAYELAGDVLKLTPVRSGPESARVVSPVKQADGSFHWPVELTNEEISAAIRADRDAQ